MFKCGGRGGKVDGRGDGGCGLRDGRLSGSSSFAEVFCQRVAAERDADGVDAAVTGGQQAEHVGELGRVAAVVHAFGGYAAAAAEMRHHAVPAAFAHRVHHFDGVVAAAAAFQAVKQDDERGFRVCRIDEVVSCLFAAAAVGQQFAAVGRRGALQQFGIYGLQVAAGQPEGAVQGRQVCGQFAVVHRVRPSEKRRGRVCRRASAIPPPVLRWLPCAPGSRVFRWFCL